VALMHEHRLHKAYWNHLCPLVWSHWRLDYVEVSCQADAKNVKKYFRVICMSLSPGLPRTAYVKGWTITPKKLKKIRARFSKKSKGQSAKTKKKTFFMQKAKTKIVHNYWPQKKFMDCPIPSQIYNGLSLIVFF